jgi:hypothetical protein
MTDACHNDVVHRPVPAGVNLLAFLAVENDLFHFFLSSIWLPLFVKQLFKIKTFPFQFPTQPTASPAEPPKQKTAPCDQTHIRHQIQSVQKQRTPFFPQAAIVCPPVTLANFFWYRFMLKIPQLS